ncbi:MAG: UDP-N-acetylmuramoyl-L-alanyl-D-glutamate--2,6-diaminopimelate ligase [Candidatus Solincola sediminis]|uniref:UDP-N-acetylmuramoyl-L-alanyl-D-glutamate--2,6-diaminopimelate ligase n=1 Tax=Candidatus Solincola sediminis TaxID=1797199 RepID=A0A1F2WRW3_9ACTN|nr:MAG: UDP-N-acetylmuramoyl-L-alanyl-D-glutamate--2,6-diaminopimelate ligase [Candidatus Solincola sediminis]OFW60944.1 MAG: UDP-N-acetylmuramoyl-L-alanyl-D-glutamate--2,6-diaminopimelate ligase [Candidatus Solincola sediminis]
MRLADLVDGFDGIRLEKGGNQDIGGIAYNSQRVGPGNIFVAIEGFKTDGHLYISEALERGATALVTGEGREIPATPPGIGLIHAVDTRLALALLSDRFWDHPSGKLKLVGVTGTNGKTTTTFLIEAAMNQAGMSPGMIGTVAYRVRGRELPAGRTTPESADLQEILATMVSEGCTAVSMEVSSHAVVLHRIDACDFDVAVFTNLSQDHLDFHPTLEDYFEEKQRLFLPRSRGGLGPRAAAINIDDPYGKLLAQSSEGEILTYGMREPADLRGEVIEMGLKRSLVQVSLSGWRQEEYTALTGAFNLYNILAALAASILLGMDPDSSFAAICAHPGVPGRFQNIEEGQDFAVLVDYAHTPDSLRGVLEAARGIARKKVIVVFGCGGDRDQGKRAVMGAIASKLADLSIITSDNPRSEDPLAIIREIEEGARSTSGAAVYQVIANRRTAIDTAIREAVSGDVVIIAGKGHEKYQILADRTIPFDDEAETRAALRRRLA